MPSSDLITPTNGPFQNHLIPGSNMCCYWPRTKAPAGHWTKSSGTFSTVTLRRKVLIEDWQRWIFRYLQVTYIPMWKLKKVLQEYSWLYVCTIVTTKSYAVFRCENQPALCREGRSYPLVMSRVSRKYYCSVFKCDGYCGHTFLTSIICQAKDLSIKSY